MRKIIKSAAGKMGYQISKTSTKSSKNSINYEDKKYISLQVQQALSLPNFENTSVNETFKDSIPSPTDASITSKELFSLNQVPLPCWQETDFHKEDDWLISPLYYPAYYKLLQHLSKGKSKIRMLEIGVRTGYLAVVFAKACAHLKSHYVGVDPNLYVENGLLLASKSLQLLRNENNNFDFTLMQGYSWNLDIQKSIEYGGPYDIIHIDGDHTLLGKLIDLDLAQGLLTPDGTVLVDDYEHISLINDSINRALMLKWYNQFAYYGTKRGLAILKK